MEKYNFEYYHELTPEPSILDAGGYLLLAGLLLPWTFFCTEDDNLQILQKVVHISLSREHSHVCAQ